MKITSALTTKFSGRLVANYGNVLYMNNLCLTLDKKCPHSEIIEALLIKAVFWEGSALLAAAVEGCSWVRLSGCRFAAVSLLLLYTGRLNVLIGTWEVKK